MSYQLSTQSKFSGRSLYATGTGVRVRRLLAGGTGPDMTDSGIISTTSAPNTLGRGTGRQLVPVPAYQNGILQEGWVEVVTTAGRAGWVRHDLLSLLTPTAQLQDGDGEKLVHALVGRDRVLGQRLAYCGELLRRIKASPGRVSAAQMLQLQATFDGLHARLKQRQQRLQTSKLIKIKGYESPTEQVFGKGGPRVGVVPFVMYAVAVGVVLVVGGLLVWQYFKSDGEASEIDMSKARTFEALLATAAPEIQQKVLEEVNGQLKDAYDKGASENGGPLAGLGDALKWGVLGYIALQVLGGRQQGGG